MRRFIGMCAAVIFAFGSICPACGEYATAADMKEPLEVAERKEKPKSVEVSYISFEETCDGCESVVTEHNSQESEEFIWNELSKYSPSEFITAGIMGYFWRESYMRSDAVAGWPHRNLGQESDICETFTKKVDAGLEDGSSKDYFVEMVRLHYGGYGLGQWLGVGYLEHFYEFVREKNGSIGDAAVQCEFIFESLQRNEELWELLLETKDAERCGRQIGYMYDGTGSAGANTIGCRAKVYYKLFHKSQ